MRDHVDLVSAVVNPWADMPASAPVPDLAPSPPPMERPTVPSPAPEEEDICIPSNAGLNMGPIGLDRKRVGTSRIQSGIPTLNLRPALAASFEKSLQLLSKRSYESGEYLVETDDDIPSPPPPRPGEDDEDDDDDADDDETDSHQRSNSSLVASVRPSRTVRTGRKPL